MYEMLKKESEKSPKKEKFVNEIKVGAAEIVGKKGVNGAVGL